MKNYIFLVLGILLYSCSNIIIEDNIKDTDEVVLKSGTPEKLVILGIPESPTLNGEVQIDLLSPLTTDTYIHFKIKESLRASYPLVSVYYKIPAGSRYVICDIDEYHKSVKIDSVKYFPQYGEEVGDYRNIATNPVYIQICDVYSEGNDDFTIDGSVLQLSRELGNITYSRKQPGVFATASDLSCGSATFFVPDDDGGGKILIPFDPPSLPTE